MIWWIVFGAMALGVCAYTAYWVWRLDIVYVRPLEQSEYLEHQPAMICRGNWTTIARSHSVFGKSAFYWATVTHRFPVVTGPHGVVTKLSKLSVAEYLARGGRRALLALAEDFFWCNWLSDRIDANQPAPRRKLQPRLIEPAECESDEIDPGYFNAQESQQDAP